MRPGLNKFVFSKDLAERVLSFCDAPEHKQACAEVSVLIGYDPASVRPWLSDTQAPGSVGLVVPKDHVLGAENPNLLRQPFGQLSTVGQAPSSELVQARSALFDATRLLMRAAPEDKLTQELFDAACEAWLAQVTQEPDLRVYAANREVLIDTRTIWGYKQTHGRVNLMSLAQLPPFFDGNTQLVELFLQSPHAGSDFAALARLPKLQCLTLYTKPGGDIVASVQALLPHLSKTTPANDKVVHLSAPGYALPED